MAHAEHGAALERERRAAAERVHAAELERERGVLALRAEHLQEEVLPVTHRPSHLHRL